MSVCFLAGWQGTDVLFRCERNHARPDWRACALSGARKVISSFELECPGRRRLARSRRPLAQRDVSESVFSMDGDIAPLAELANLAETICARRDLGRGHARAIHGPKGTGLAAAARALLPKFSRSSHTCGKAVASAGAFVCGPLSERASLESRPHISFFDRAYAIFRHPQIGAAIGLAKEIMNEERASLLYRAATFARPCKPMAFDPQGLPARVP